MMCAIELPNDYVSMECGALCVACPPASPLAAALVDLWRAGRLAAFAAVLPKHAETGRATGRGLCHEIVMAFLQAAGDLDVRAVWARTPAGWHTWVEFGAEAFDVVMTDDGPLVLVQPVSEFCASRGIIR